MRFLYNTYDPKRYDAKERVFRREDETPEEAWERHQRDLVGKVLGVPKATEDYNTDELVRAGMVGVYDPE